MQAAVGTTLHEITSASLLKDSPPQSLSIRCCRGEADKMASSGPGKVVKRHLARRILDELTGFGTARTPH
jgi:hypothetical protein